MNILKRLIKKEVLEILKEGFKVGEHSISIRPDTILPSVSGSYDIGSSDFPWRNIYGTIVPSPAGGMTKVTSYTYTDSGTTGSLFVDGFDETDIQIRVRANLPGSSNFLRVFFNGDETTTNYRYQNMRLAGVAPAYTADNDAIFGFFNSGSLYMIMHAAIDGMSFISVHGEGSSFIRLTSITQLNFTSIIRKASITGSIVSVNISSSATTFASGSCVEVWK